MFGRKQGEKKRRPARRESLKLAARTQRARRARWRWVLLALSVATLTTVVGLTGWRGFQEFWQQRVVHNPLFALREIEVTTQGHWVTRAQILHWAGVKVGDNALTLNLGRIQHDLTLEPQIQSVSVERVLPHLLRLRVLERTPLAQVQVIQSDGRGGFMPAVYYLDRFGVVMPSPAPNALSPGLVRALRQLPYLTGMKPSDLLPGRPVRNRAVRAALALIAQFPHSPMASVTQIKRVDVMMPQLLRVATADGETVLFSYTHLARQLRRWRAIRDAGVQFAHTIAWLDLSLSNNCPVLWAAGAPGSGPLSSHPNWQLQ